MKEALSHLVKPLGVPTTRQSCLAELAIISLFAFRLALELDKKLLLIIPVFTPLLISDVAYERIKDSVEVRNFVRLKLRGSSQLITLHELSSVHKNDLINHSIAKEKEIDGENWLRTLPISELEKGEKKKLNPDANLCN